jgi:DNA-binding CsgD family transcriptional regulator
LVDIESAIEEIYEATNTPERWHDVLHRMAELSGAEGALLFTPATTPVRWICSPKISPFVTDWISSGWVSRTPRMRSISMLERHFLTDLDGFTLDELESEPFYRDFLRPRGLGWCAATVFRLRFGNIVALSIEKAYEKGPVDRKAVDMLDTLRPHLERAATLSISAGRRHARIIVSLLQTFGIPAAVLTHNAQSLAANQSFLNDTPDVRIGADDRLTFSDVEAQASLVKALAAIDDPPPGTARRRMVISGTQNDRSSVAHLARLDQATRDIFSEAHAILMMTPTTNQLTPDPSSLMRQYDLTRTEARITNLLVQGHTVRAIARMQGVEDNTIRMQLKSVFSKTGVHRQAQLVSFMTQKPFG